MDNKDQTEYSEQNEKFDSSRDFIPPSPYQLGRLASKYPELTTSDAIDQDHHLDNRLAVRILIWKSKNGDLTVELFNRLVEPYDNGYYLKADGKSSPIWWTKVMGLQKLLGVQKDIAAVRHDYDYYRGKPKRKLADKYYFYSQISLGQSIFWAKIEYFALRLFGCGPWDRHREKNKDNKDYGTDPYIKTGLANYQTYRERLKDRLRVELT